MIFLDRIEAGNKLAVKLKKFKGKKNTIVLALPRGGVPVGAEIASFLNSPLDVLIVRKIGAPYNPEFALGAIASGGKSYLDKLTIKNLGIRPEEIEGIIEKEIAEMNRRQKEYRGNLPFPGIKGKTVILVDDGIATGATIKAAIFALRSQKPKKLVVASPVCSLEVAREIKSLADAFICLYIPEVFSAVGAFYKNFNQITDGEVKQILRSLNNA